MTTSETRDVEDMPAGSASECTIISVTEGNGKVRPRSGGSMHRRRDIWSLYTTIPRPCVHALLLSVLPLTQR